MLLGRKLGGDAVHLEKYPRLPGGVPGEGHGAQVDRILLDLGDPVAQRQVNLQNPLVGVGARPLRYLLVLNVLQPSLVETDSDGAAEPLLLVVVGYVSQLFYLCIDLVSLLHCFI